MAIEEHDLVQEVDDHLDRYFEKRGRILYRSYLPRDSRQNFFDPSQHCADLIGCIGGWQPLLLEFKVLNDGVLPSFNKVQHAGLEILNSFGIPVQYCFNKLPFLCEAAEDLFLDNLLVCMAKPLPGRKPLLTHTSLLQRLNSVGTGAPPSLTPLAICDANLFGKARLGQLNTARILILSDGVVTNLSVDQGAALVRALLDNKNWGRDKNVSRLRQDLDGLIAERNRLLGELSAAGWGMRPTAHSDTALRTELSAVDDNKADDSPRPSF